MNCGVGGSVPCNYGPPSSLAGADRVSRVAYVCGGGRNSDFF